MTSTVEEKAFLKVAVAVMPRVAEIISGFRPKKLQALLHKLTEPR
jgi:hypothetical protein